MALTIKSDRIGQQSQVETATKKLNKEAKRRGWDLKNDVCPRHG